ncbi:MAG TPA: 1-deoxy-D-xylulose-5-phosphate synthase N-terminal domain-containing protein [bacterium]|nr:1-deoxy-D-xylulose-5-phosphate synthase N-terminal domain-containing protein [bacterium]
MVFIAERAYYRAASGRRRLAVLAALNRINALACIKSAEHGWLGASFSVAELLTVLTFDRRARNVILSKGHAAPMQYACLFGTGRIGAAQLRSYKNGAGALQAHTDTCTPGILVNSGSLGQALSKAAGMARVAPREEFFVIIGDGELQEGQNFEALQSIVQLGLRNLTVILDRNVFQTEYPVDAIKGIRDYRQVFAGFGYTVLAIDGHDPAAISAALRRKVRGQKLIIAQTRKAGGSALLAPVRGKQPWHAQVPGRDLYAALLHEQAALTGNARLQTAVAAFTARLVRQPQPVPPAPRSGSTRDLFWDAVLPHYRRNRKIMVLDADLAKSCGLDRLPSRPRQFVELGISEQDMVSFAGGLALRGYRPIVNTYASFFKRAYEQLCVNQSEQVPVIYAGHYAGFDYHTDGKTHQSINDLSLMRSVPGLAVFEPVTARQTRLYVDWALRQRTRSSYFRLRRTPLPLALDDRAVRLDCPLTAGREFARCFVTGGIVATALALRCREEQDFARWGVLVQGAYGLPLDRPWYARRLARTREIVVLEDNFRQGGLYEFTCALVNELGLRVRVRALAPDFFGWSFRTFDDCLRHFGFTPDGVRAVRRDGRA